MKTPETCEGPRRLILEDPAVLIGCCAVRLPLGQPADCAADYPFGLAFRSASDSHRLPAFRRCLPTQPPTLIGVRSTASLPVALRLAPPNNPPAQPSGQPATYAADRPSGSALVTGLRLAPPADPSAMPSDEPPACAFDPSSSSTFQPASSFRLRPTFRSCLRTQPPTLIGRCIRGLRLVSTSGLRLQSTFGCAFGSATDRRREPTFQLRLPDGLRLAPTANLPALPSKQLPTHANRFALGAAVRSTVDLRHRSTVRPCL